MAMDSIRLNNLPTGAVNVDASQCGGSGERADIVSCGRLLAAEYAGKSMNALRNAEKREEKFNSLMGEGMSYKELNEKGQKNLLLFCAKVSDKLEGKESPETMEAFRKNQRGYFTNPIFLRTLAGIVTDIVTPVLPATFSDAMDWLAQTVYAPLGKTYEIDVQSNDIFLFEDDSWGASRSKPSNYLYAKTLTMNPTLRTAKATWKWYQLAGNDADLGRTFNAISAGMYSKITALWVNALVAASTNTMYTPTNMQFTFSNTNWVTAAKRVAMLNGTGVSNVMAFGDLLALSHVLPSSANGTNTSLDAALATMLGVPWARYGYLDDFMGVRLFPINNAVVPGTQNTTITEVVPNNMVWMTAAPNGSYKPVYVCFEEGSPITLELTPDETADMTIDIVVSMSIDVKPVFASKLAVITPV